MISGKIRVGGILSSRELCLMGIIATPDNSSANELVMEAARMSILSDGIPVRIVYGGEPHVERR